MDLGNQKLDVPETVIIIGLDEDGETEKSRIGGEEGDLDVKGNRLEGSEVKVKSLKKSDDIFMVIDVECNGLEGNELKVKDLEGNGSGGNEVKVKDLKQSDDFSTVIDVKCIGSEGNEVKVKDLEIGDDFSTVIDVKCNGSEGNEVKVKDLERSDDFSTVIDVTCNLSEGNELKVKDLEGNGSGGNEVRVKNLMKSDDFSTVINVKCNGSEGNEVKVKDLKKSDDFSTVIDVTCNGKLGEDLEGECQRVCRICHLSTYEAETNLVDLIELGCGCKGELGFVHSHCAEAWFKVKGNRVCEICGEIAQSVTGVINNRFIEEWNDARSTASGTGSTETTRGCWHGQPFCNFLMACLVISFVLPWFFRVDMF